MPDILKLIQGRQSSRTLYDNERQIPKEDMLKILEAGRWTPTAHNMQNFEIVVVDDKKLLAAISRIRHPTSLTFIKENYEQLSFSEDELKQKKVGIMGALFPPSWRTPDPKPEEVENESRGEFMEKLIQSSSALLFVLYDPNRRAPASEGDFLGVISLGCAMENMWLMANSLGIGLHVLSSLSEGQVQKEIRRLLNIPEYLSLAYTLRLGYPVSPVNYLRVRRDIEDFTRHNNFNSKGMD